MTLLGGKLGRLTAIVSLLIGANSWATAEYVPGEIIVKYKDGVARNKADMDALYQQTNTRHVSRMRGIMQGIEQIRIQDNADMNEAIAVLQNSDLVEYAEPNYIIKALPVVEHRNTLNNPEAPSAIPCFLPGVHFPPNCEPWTFPGRGGGGGGGNRPSRPPLADKPGEVNPPQADPQLSSAYGIAKIGADRVWPNYKGNSNFVVAVIDTGIDYNHEDLSFNVWRNPAPTKGDIVGYDFVHDDGIPFDDNKHGTHCAGVIGAVGGNGKGVSGVNQRVSIMAVKFLSAQGSGDTGAAIRSIEYAVRNGAKVLSNSWGGGSATRSMEDAIKRSEAAGTLFIAAAGNESNNNDSSPSYPASYHVANVVSVAATDSSDHIANFSNYGVQSVHLAAPGVRVYSTVPGNNYQSLSGTSMATPHVAGAAALVWSAHPEWTYSMVKDKLLGTVDAVAELREKTITGGRLNVLRAISQ